MKNYNFYTDFLFADFERKFDEIFEFFPKSLANSIGKLRGILEANFNKNSSLCLENIQLIYMKLGTTRQNLACLI